jgi:hypothetical protein
VRWATVLAALALTLEAERQRRIALRMQLHCRETFGYLMGVE